VIKERRFWFWTSAVFIAAAVLALAFWLDPMVRSWILAHPNHQLRRFMGLVSRFGDWPEHVALGLLLLSFALWRGCKKWSRVFVAMLIACALAGLVARVIKIGAGRARPSVKTEQVWNGPRFSEKYHAFPSGHTAASTAFFGVLLFVSWRIGLVCMLIPLLIAVSRMYVAAHYLSDVVFAAILGLACAFVVSKKFVLTKSRLSGASVNVAL
jgi:membrane-associated phospholipid phosphatase